MAFDVHAYLRKVDELLTIGSPFVSVTLVETRGSAPQIQGAKAIIADSGIMQGTLGGGKVEAKAIVHAIELLRKGDGTYCDFRTWNLQSDVGMTCGGEVKFFFEVFNYNDWKITLFGAGHVAQSLVPLLLSLNCLVTCIDQRQVWLDRLPVHPRLNKILANVLNEEVKNIAPKSFVLLMTQGHATDLPVLTEILQTMQAPYLGVIGSLQKAKVLKRNLKEQGILAERTDSFFCPVGLPIGNNTPAEIAISIVAQLLQERDRLAIVKHKSKAF